MEKTPQQPGTRSEDRVCPQCGAELPKGVSAEFCPKCLLSAAMGPKTAVGADTVPIPHIPAKTGVSIENGQVFGHYRIIRPLGGGGMGTVFEAEDLDNSRRVALKILSHKLDSPEARERFFREGRLAASINHPNSVYIFGTEEIAGTPVISMELLAGGTLQDRINKRGPMPPGEAVDAVLQIIEGLEAAQRSGILHRDVKPSNCFVDQNGTIKIGDFGLSISTGIRTEPALTADGAFLGTPAFCPPEQLRGEELNIRSDIYSVGATLFYLLTGRTPFEAQNVVALIATVLERPSPSPRDLRPEISQGLAKAVQKCLNKVRGERHGSYAELRHALEPYSSAAPIPATLGVRFLAGVLDFTILNIFIMLVVMVAFGGLMNLIEAMTVPNKQGLLFMFGGFVFSLLYYAISEGRFGATPGKAICRLAVIGPNRNLPGVSRASIRALLYILLPPLPFWIAMTIRYRGDVSLLFEGAAWSGSNNPWYYLLASTPYVVMALLFVTARSRNGWRAVHDFASRTQVIVRSQAVVRSSTAQPSEPVPLPSSRGLIGPYQILEDFGQQQGVRWLIGYDLRLLRKVWIWELPPSAPPFPPALRNVGRPGRLRWLTGKRSPAENWDAFEAPGGQGFLTLACQPHSWQQVRFWLWELAQELAAARRDHTEPEALSLDRVWITSGGSPKLLDFPQPGSDASASISPPSPAQASMKPEEFLARFAAAALSGDASTHPNEIPRPLPLYARAFVSDLYQMPNSDLVIERLAPLLRRCALVTRFRRSLMMLGCVGFPLFTLVSSFFGLEFLREFEQRHPDLIQLNQVLSMRQGMKFVPSKSQISDEHFAIYIASHYRDYITNDKSWNSPLARTIISGAPREFAEQSVARYPTASPEEIKRVEKTIKPGNMASINKELGKFRLIQIIFYSSLVMYVIIPAIIAALLFRGGLVVLLARVAYVTRDGSRASRLRLFWRSLLVWAPVFLGLMLTITAITTGTSWIGLLGLCLLAAITSISLSIPDRGLQDRLSGTWPVPR